MSFYDQREHEASERLSAVLALPPIPGDDVPYSDGECFNPWNLFPCVYGSYSSAFDEMAIEVLTDIRDGTYNRTDLAAEMFREMLCTGGFCEYGTSPRVCFPAEFFEEKLPRLIERWKEYSALQWKDAAP